MHRLKKAILVLAAAAAILGCGISSLNIPVLLSTATSAPPTPTAIVSSPTSTPGPTDTPVIATPTQPVASFTPIPTLTVTEAAAGDTIDYRGLTVTMPTSLGTGMTNATSTSVEFPYVNPSNGDMPEHIRLVINGYAVPNTVLQPEIMVFPAAQYAEYSDYTRQIVTALQTMQYYDGQPLPQGFPDGPFNAHVASVQFANGHGIRYLTQFDQAPLPANNRELIYYFHGLTDAGDFYVEAVLPVQAPFLAPDEDPASPLPAGGIPFSLDNLGAYFQDIANKLNATPPDDFSPALSTLDAMVRSIRAEPPQ